MGLPDFLIIGAPKAGSTALHAALALHPELSPASIKEPKYFLCDDRPPNPASQRGPGDAHSAREWVWRRGDYERLFDEAPPGRLRYESSPFYLWDSSAHERIARTVPQIKLIAVIRDPIDRAFSNWTHLRADGLEPERDFLAACLAEPRRVAAGWAPFWRYLELGRYGEQLQHLFGYVPPERVLVLRYRLLVDEAQRTLDTVCEFLGITPGLLSGLPESNLGRWTQHSALNDMLRTVVRAGATAGAHVPPQFWRAAEKPLLRLLQRGSPIRPRLSGTDRRHLVPYFEDANSLLTELLGSEYADWLKPDSAGSYTTRRAHAAAAAADRRTEAVLGAGQ